MKTGSALLVCLAILCQPVSAMGEERQVLVAFDIQDESNSLDKDLLNSLTEYLAASVAECDTYRLVPPWELKRLWKLEKMVSGRGCTGAECQLKMALHLGARLSVSTAITRTADTCTVVSTLDDIRQQTRLISARAQGDCGEPGLAKALEDVAYFIVLWGDCSPSEVTPETIEALYEEEIVEPVKRSALLEDAHTSGARDMGEDLVGAVPDLLFTTGWAVQDREIGKPVQKSGVGHGMRFEGRLFLGAFVDTPVLEDFGFAGMYSYSTGYEYYLERSVHDSNASHSHWQAEVIFRSAFNQVKTQPAILIRFGAGGADYQIDKGYPIGKSAQYSYPYVALDAYFMPYQPYVRAFASFAWMFHVEPFDDLEGGPFQGIKLAAGIDVVIDVVHVGIGYELMRVYKVEVQGEEGTTSDRYLGFVLRLGCTYH